MYYYLVKLKGTEFVDVFETNKTYEIATDVLVSSNRGVELGRITKEMHPMQSMGTILSEATQRDRNDYWDNIALADSAMTQTSLRIKEHKLNMNVLSVHYNLDRSKVFINYLVESRIDFRSLLRDLSQDLKTRIELKQLGARDYAKKIGCLGACGRSACCGFKRKFESITINMARSQMIPLNNEALTGSRGSLKCCLAFENDVYLECKKDFPRIKSKINYKNQEYTVVDFNCISRKVLLSNNENRLYVPLEEIKGEST